MAAAPAPVDAPSEAQGKTAVKDGGLLLGRFELGRLLGAGTFAKVYFARNARTGEHVAIKALDKAKVFRGGLVPHIKREIAVLRRVRHPYIVQLHEVMATRTKIYFVMEYVSGGELFSRVAKGRMREDTARRYFQQLISAVAFCHARGVFHRDLKPENLLVDDAGDLKVSDFGLSAVSDQMPGDGLFHTLCGTPAYVAPEVLSRRGYDGAKFDIWSCGVILFVLMAGYVPFQDQNLMAMYRKINKGEFRCPGWFSPDLIRLLRHLLDVNPQTRFSIPDIMDHPWFKKGFRLVRFYIEDHQLHNLNGAGSSQKLEESHDPLADEAYDSGSDSDASVVSCPEKSFNARRLGQAVTLPRPMSLNAVSSSENPSIEQPRRLGLPRPLSLNAFDIISFSQGFDLSGLFEETGEKTRFLSNAPVSVIIAKLEEIAKLMSFSVRRSGYRVSLEGTIEGEKGPLTIAAEIFELTRSIVVVEVTKKSGDREEYEEFCAEELKPALRHLVYESPLVGKMSSSTNCNLEERKEKQEV